MKNLPNSARINRRQATGKNTFRKCPECKNNVACYMSGKMLFHSDGKENCPAIGYSPSEWVAEKAKREEEAIALSEKNNSWWGKEGF